MLPLASSDGYENCAVADAYASLARGLRRVAAMNIVIEVMATSADRWLAKGQGYRLSDDFPEGMTTIVTADELGQLAEEGQLTRLVREQSVIAMCSIFEGFVDQMVELSGRDSRKAGEYATMTLDFGLQRGSGNATLRKIYYLIKQFGFTDHPFERDQAVDMLNEVFCIRNAVVHTSGRITRNDAAIGLRYKVNGSIQLPPNAIDDFVHRIDIHMRGFSRRIDRVLGQ